MRFWVAFGAGRLSDAYDAATEVGHVYPAVASWFSPYAAICALWERDRERAVAALAALDSTGAHGPVVDMNRRTILAGLAALEGRPGEALSAFRLEPADPEVRMAAQAACEILVRLEAAPFIARLDATLARASDRAGRSTAPKAVSVTPP